MLILFPSQPFHPRQVDSCFVEEYQAAEKTGHVIGLVNQDNLDACDFQRAVSRISSSGEKAIYRGWMLHPEHYKGLCRALESNGVDLVNNSRQYMNCHWFPRFYSYIEKHSPESIWYTQLANGYLGVDELTEWVKKFGNSPLIIKDFVKSRKHEWEEACFVPNASDGETFQRIVNTFIKRQGALLAGGVVARKFISLKKIGVHEKSGMPLFNEYRTFVLNGKPIITGRYWTQGQIGDRPNLDEFETVIKSVDSNLFTMDLAQTENGDWIIIELGDGQVSGLQGIDPYLFYHSIK